MYVSFTEAKLEQVWIALLIDLLDSLRTMTTPTVRRESRAGSTLVPGGRRLPILSSLSVLVELHVSGFLILCVGALRLFPCFWFAYIGISQALVLSCGFINLQHPSRDIFVVPVEYFCQCPFLPSLSISVFAVSSTNNKRVSPTLQQSDRSAVCRLSLKLTRVLARRKVVATQWRTLMSSSMTSSRSKALALQKSLASAFLFMVSTTDMVAYVGLRSP